MGPGGLDQRLPSIPMTCVLRQDSAEAGKTCIILWANPTARRRCVLWPCVLRRHGGGARCPASVAGDWPGVDGGMARRASSRQGHRFAMQKYPHLSGKFNPPTHFGERESTVRQPRSVAQWFAGRSAPPLESRSSFHLCCVLGLGSWVCCCCRRDNKEMERQSEVTSTTKAEKLRELVVHR